MIECKTCLQKGWTPRRATIFDIDLEVTAVGTKGQQTVLQILQRSNPRPIQISDPELLKTVAALDLAKQFTPTPIARQCEVWGIPYRSTPEQTPPAHTMMGGQPVLPQQPAMPTMGQGLVTPFNPGMGMPGFGNFGR